MHRYNKYIIARIIGPMILICFSLTAIIWLTQSLRFIDLIVNRGLNISTFLYFSSLILPSLLWVILPLSLFISITSTYNKLVTDSELIVLNSSGISRLGIIKPILLVSLFTVGLSYAIALYLLPASYREFKDMQSFIRDNYISVLLQEGVFTNPTRGLTVYIHERADDGMLRGMLVHDNRTPEKPVTMLAEEGKFIQTPEGSRFILINGNRQEIEQNGNQISLLYFDRYTLDINTLMTENEPQRWREPEERYLEELLNPEDTPPHLQAKLFAEAHNRMTWPLYNLILGLFAAIPFVLGELNRRGQWKRILITSLFAVSFVIGGIALNNLAAKNNLYIPLMYINVILAIVLGLYIVLRYRRMKDIPLIRTLFYPI